MGPGGAGCDALQESDRLNIKLVSKQGRLRAAFCFAKKEGPAGMVDAGPRTGERLQRSNLWLTQG